MERTQRNKSASQVYGVCLEWQMYNTEMSCTNCLKEKFIRRVKARTINQSNGVKVWLRYSTAGKVLRLRRIHSLACSHDKNLVVICCFSFRVLHVSLYMWAFLNYIFVLHEPHSWLMILIRCWVCCF